ncbi:hypothetical protein TIFTF001_023611 [Ficus carica]|uniref:C-JID domain-containing protein n=1 Tax=Ficus carica TaxID=3494 RepID=A0AA88AUY0_FICCA|nr:hypothetical protein TIFTF001_023611 [Ficus carica]
MSLKMIELSKDIYLDPQVFKEMCNLKFLEFIHQYGCTKKLYLPQGLRSLPDELRYLRWDHFPLKSLPQNFTPQNLVELHLENSHLESLPNEIQEHQKAAIICFPGYRVPNWFNYQNKGCSINLKPPPYWSEAIDMVLCFCFVLAFKKNGKNVGHILQEDSRFELECEMIVKTDCGARHLRMFIWHINSAGRVPDLNHVFMVTHSYVRRPDVSSAKEVSFEFRLTDSVEIEIQRCGIRIVRLQDTVDFVTRNGDYQLGGSSDFLDEPEECRFNLIDSETFHGLVHMWHFTEYLTAAVECAKDMRVGNSCYCGTKVGINIDPQAIAYACQNAALNDIGPKQMRLHIVPETTSTGVKNLCGIAEAQNSNNTEVMPETEKFDPGAVVGLSGILSEQLPVIMEQYSRYLEGMSVTEMDDWACVYGTKKRNVPAAN